LPYVGTVAACAGRVVAVASPDGTREKYNWARVLRHEFVHVVNLEQTDFNIPHWFTEALAVSLEGYARPDAWYVLLADRIADGTLFDLETINLGFIRPASQADWQLAYCQAELYARYMKAAYGEDALARMLAAYRDHLDTKAAIRKSFRVSVGEFEKGYRKFLEERVADFDGNLSTPRLGFDALVTAHEAAPNDADIAAQLALEYLGRKQYATATALVDDVLERHARHPLAAYVRARLYLTLGKGREATDVLSTALDRDAPQPDALALLAGLRYKAARYDEAIELYELGRTRFDRQTRWVRLLAKAQLKASKTEPLARTLAELAQREPDNLLVRKKLTQMAADAGEHEQVVRWGREAIYADSQDAPVHKLLGRALAALARHDRAAEHFEFAVRLAPGDTAARRALAESALAAGNQRKAREAIEELLARDPEYPGAKELLEKLHP
jgi:tetratricopeptide (TPR) repeat protein